MHIQFDSSKDSENEYLKVRNDAFETHKTIKFAMFRSTKADIRASIIAQEVEKGYIPACQLKYVGQTGNAIKERFRNHFYLISIKE